ncbi:MAG TPA: hypothetical protein PLA94_28020 [Myxococcota bacterium]|nr:hypothetical protein [Myxococcota bacterium]
MSLLLIAACTYEFGLTSKPGGSAGELDSEPRVEEDSAVEESKAPHESMPVESATNGDPPDSPPQDSPPQDEPPADDCADTSDLIYVISREDGTLYLFDPPTLSFTALARPACNRTQTPGSMAISRDGHAFVRYADDSVYDIDLATFACAPTPYSDRRTRFGSFGMGYATDSSNTWRDQLYVANADHLAMMDSQSWAVTTLGTIPSQAELTGNAQGELWAILPLEHPAKLVELDKTNGRTLQTLPLPGFPSAQNIDTFAFATWNGDFYLFIRESGMGNHSDVYKVTGSGTLSKEVTNIGFDIVGAGVSTCAPA